MVQLLGSIKLSIVLHPGQFLTDNMLWFKSGLNTDFYKLD